MRTGRPPVHPAIRFENYVDRDGECHEWLGGKNRDGYGIFSMSSKRKNVQAHRAAWELAFGPIAEGLCVCHHCDNPGCVNVDHLWLGTNAENTADKVWKGRAHHAKGTKHGQAKLTEDDINAIRDSDETYKVLGERYGVRHSHIGKIKRREIWTHLP